MTVTSIRDRIKLILEDWISENELPSNWTVHRYLPRVLNHADLPAFVTWPGSADYSGKTNDSMGVVRVYPIRLYVVSLADGTANEAETKAEQHIDSVATFLASRPRLELNHVGLNYILSSQVTGDAGFFGAYYPDPPQTPNAPQFLTLEWRWRITARRILNS